MPTDLDFIRGFVGNVGTPGVPVLHPLLGVDASTGVVNGHATRWVGTGSFTYGEKNIDNVPARPEE